MHPECLLNALEHGQIDMVIWLRGLGMPWPYCSLDVVILSNNLRLIQYIISETNCKISGIEYGLYVAKLLYKYKREHPAHICYMAVMTNNLEMMKWAHKEGMFFTLNENDRCELFGKFGNSSTEKLRKKIWKEVEHAPRVLCEWWPDY
jgi:hypothetical protein